MYNVFSTSFCTCWWDSGLLFKMATLTVGGRSNFLYDAVCLQPLELGVSSIAVERWSVPRPLVEEARIQLRHPELRHRLLHACIHLRTW